MSLDTQTLETHAIQQSKVNKCLELINELNMDGETLEALIWAIHRTRKVLVIQTYTRENFDSDKEWESALKFAPNNAYDIHEDMEYLETPSDEEEEEEKEEKDEEEEDSDEEEEEEEDSDDDWKYLCPNNHWGGQYGCDLCYEHPLFKNVVIADKDNSNMTPEMLDENGVYCYKLHKKLLGH